MVYSSSPVPVTVKVKNRIANNLKLWCPMANTNSGSVQIDWIEAGVEHVCSTKRIRKLGWNISDLQRAKFVAHLKDGSSQVLKRAATDWYNDERQSTEAPKLNTIQS